MPDQILAFWFSETEPKQWWAADPDFNRRVTQRFLPVLGNAVRGELFPWRTTARGRLAEVIVLDQFSRNVYRNTPQAFSQDPMALALSQEAVALGTMDGLETAEAAFLLMPYMHSESPLIHQEAERLFKRWAPQSFFEFELRHKAVIDRFGRYPHRNGILGRVSTPEEEEFLQQPGSSF